MAEPKVGDYCYYLPSLIEFRSIVGHQVYRIVGLTSNKGYLVTLKQLQPPNIVDRAAISVMELNESIRDSRNSKRRLTTAICWELPG